jgi:hypothetical protein
LTEKKTLSWVKLLKATVLAALVTMGVITVQQGQILDQTTDAILEQTQDANGGD